MKSVTNGFVAAAAVVMNCGGLAALSPIGRTIDRDNNAECFTTPFSSSVGEDSNASPSQQRQSCALPRRQLLSVFVEIPGTSSSERNSALEDWGRGCEATEKKWEDYFTNGFAKFDELKSTYPSHAVWLDKAIFPEDYLKDGRPNPDRGGLVFKGNYLNIKDKKARGEPCALKVINPWVHGPRNIYNEVSMHQLVQDVCGESVVKLLGFTQINGDIFNFGAINLKPFHDRFALILEECTGSLFSLGRDITTADLCAISQELLRSLVLLHDNNIVLLTFRRPDVLYQKHSEGDGFPMEISLKLCDFGSALHNPEKVKTSELGTLASDDESAPEWRYAVHFRSDYPISTKADVYSFGAFLMDYLDFWEEKAEEVSDVEKRAREELLELADLCQQHSPDDRPTIQQVKRTIDNISKYVYEAGLSRKLRIRPIDRPETSPSNAAGGGSPSLPARGSVGAGTLSNYSGSSSCSSSLGDRSVPHGSASSPPSGSSTLTRARPGVSARPRDTLVKRN